MTINGGPYASVHPLCPGSRLDSHEPWLCGLCQELNRGTEAIALLRDVYDSINDPYKLEKVYKFLKGGDG